MQMKCYINKYLKVVIILFLLNTLAYAQSSQYMEITDCMNRNVTVPTEINRVISINADATRILVSLGCGDKIVGVDSYSLKCPILKHVYPQLQNVTDVGSHISGTLSTEAIAALKPDVIFLGGSSKDLAEKIQSELGIPCVCTYFGVKKVDDFLCAYDVIGKVMAKQNRSYEVQEYIRSKINEVLEISSNIPAEDKPKVLLVGVPLDSDPFKVGTVSAQVDWAGGVNVGADAYKGGSPSKTVTIEQIAQWDPDIILINGLARIDVVTIKDDQRWKQLRAVKDGRVYKIYSGMVGYDPALFVIQTLNMAKIMHPDKYDFDFGAEVDQVFGRIYGISGIHSVLQAEFGISEI